MKETGNKCNLGEQGPKQIKILILGNKGNAELFQGNKGRGTPPPPLRGPHLSNAITVTSGHLLAIDTFCSV